MISIITSSKSAIKNKHGPTTSSPKRPASAPTRAGTSDWPSTAAAIWNPTPLAVCLSPNRAGVVAMSVGKTGAAERPIKARPRKPSLGVG